MKTANMEGNGVEILYVTSQYEESIKLEIPSVNNVSYYSTIAFGTLVLRIPSNQLVTNLTSRTRQRGIRLTSAKEFDVFGVGSGNSFSEGFAAISLRQRAVKYVIVAFNLASKLYYSTLIVVSNATKTRITVNLKTTATVLYRGNVYKNGETIECNLNDLDVLQLSCHGDLTGTAVYSDKPISVFSGTDCSFVASELQGHPKKPCGRLIEQIPPVDEWGREFITTPHGDQGAGKTLRIVAGFRGVTVTSNCVSGYVKSREYIEIHSAEPCHILCSEPCFVVQYGQGNITLITKPFMALVSPITKYENSFLLPTPFVSDHSIRAFITIIIQIENIPGLLIDEHNVWLKKVKWTKIPESNFTIAQISATSPEQLIHIRHHSPEVTLGVTLYGLGAELSFGFPGGWADGMSKKCLQTTNSGSSLDINCIAGTNEDKIPIRKKTFLFLYLKIILFELIELVHRRTM